MFSKACTYGIRAVLYLATFSGVDQKIGVSELAEILAIPRHFLAKILQQLGRDNLVSSLKGPGGGFYLSEQDARNTLFQVIVCIDGPDVFSTCLLGFESCSNDNPCPLHLLAYSFREGLKLQLMHYSLAEVALRIKRENIRL